MACIQLYINVEFLTCNNAGIYWTRGFKNKTSTKQTIANITGLLFFSISFAFVKMKVLKQNKYWMTLAYFKHLTVDNDRRKKITMCSQLLISTHFINYSEFREAVYLISFWNAKKIAFSKHANACHSCSMQVFDRNPKDSKMSSKAKSLTK